MRRIDADALKDAFCEACSTKKRYKRTDAECRTHSNALYGYSCFKMRLIDTAPTIDAEPVRHGRWLPEAVSGYDGVNVVYARPCSECGYEERRFVKRYCPNCGAKMDLEVQDE